MEVIREDMISQVYNLEDMVLATTFDHWHHRITRNECTGRTSCLLDHGRLRRRLSNFTFMFLDFLDIGFGRICFPKVL